MVGGAYEVIKKSTAGGVSGEVKTAARKTGAEGEEQFSLSKCDAYGPVSSSQDTNLTWSMRSYTPQVKCEAIYNMHPALCNNQLEGVI